MNRLLHLSFLLLYIVRMAEVNCDALDNMLVRCQSDTGCQSHSECQGEPECQFQTSNASPGLTSTK